MTYRDHYNAAHRSWFAKKYPQAMADGFYCPPKMPKVATANGLTQFIVNYLDWSGWHANRISSAGRFIPGANKYDGGMFIPSTTKKGTADISSIIQGRAIMWEVKVGKDRASDTQLKMQANVRAAGGEYFFISTPDELFEILATLLQK